MKTLSDLIQEKYRDMHCGTCARLNIRKGKYGPETYCTLDGRVRFKNDMKGCLGWKERRRK